MKDRHIRPPLTQGSEQPTTLGICLLDKNLGSLAAYVKYGALRLEIGVLRKAVAVIGKVARASGLDRLGMVAKAEIELPTR
jgi:hypothetical protein